MSLVLKITKILFTIGISVFLNACSNPLGGNSSIVDSLYNPGLQVGTSTVDLTNSTIVSNSLNVVADGSSSAAVTITLRDSKLNPIPGETPTFRATDTGSTNTYSACTKSDRFGISTCSFTSTKAETKTLQLLTPGAFSGGTVRFINGSANSIAFTTQPIGNVAPNVSFATQPVVKILDANLNPVTDGPDAVANISLVLTTGTGVLGGTTTMAAVAGVAAFNNINVDTAGSGKIITATKSATSATGSMSVASSVFATNSSGPGVFSITSTSSSDSQIVVNWGAASSATSYTVKYGTTTGNYTSTASTNATSPYTITGLTSSQTYYIMVTAVNVSGSTDANSEVSATAANPPSSPTLTLSSTPGAIGLSWNSVSGTAPITYTVKRSITSGSGYTTIASGLNTTSYSDVSITNGTTYYYVVDAINAGGTISSSEQSVKAIAAFTISSISQTGNGQAQLAWNSATGAASYTVKYGTTSGSYGTTVSTSATSPLTISGLSNGTTYYFMVSAVNAVGSGTTQNATSETSLALYSVPTAPASLTATPSPGSVALSWSLVSGSGTLTYNVYRSTTSGSGYTALTTGISGTTYTDSTVTNGTTYYYVVTLNNISGESSYSNEASVRSIPHFSITAIDVNGAGALKVTFNSASGASAYTVKYGTTSGSYGTTSSTNATSPYTITGLTGGTPYYIMVSATNAVGTGASVNANAEFSGTPLSVFSISSAVATSSQTTLSWASSNGATAYDISYGTTSGNYTTTLTNKTSPFAVTGLTNGTTYYFKVIAKNATGNLDSSNEVSSSPNAVPTVPSSLTGTATHNQVALSWGASAGAGPITYNVYRSSTSGSYTSALATSISSTTYTDTTVSDGTIYYYIVTATNVGGDSNDSNEFDAEPINNFSLSTLSTASTSTDLVWGSATGASSYDIQYGTTSGTYITTLSNQSSGATISSLTPGTTYYFKVNAKNTHHGSVMSSNELSGTPVSGFAITGLNQNGAGSASLSWSSSAGSTSYDVKYGTSSGSYSTTLTNQSSPITVSGLSANQTYYFIVTANNGSGSLNSSESSVTTLALPSSPTSLAATNSSGTIDLTWNSVAGPGTISYSVYRSTTSGTYGAALATGLSSASYTDSTVSNGTVYYYKVSANNLSGESTLSSEVSSQAIAGFSISSVSVNGASALQVSWGAASGASTYTLKYGTSSGSYGTTVSTNATSPTTVSSLTPGTTYYFMVTAVNSTGSGSTVNASSEVSGVPLGTFTMATATASSAQVAITWNASTGVTSSSSYDVKYGTTSGSYTTNLTNKTSPFTVTGLTNGTTYYFKVVAKNASGNLDSSNELSATPIAAPSAAPTLTGQGTHSNSALAWTSATGSGTITYNVYRSNTSGSGYSQIASGINVNYYNDATVTDGTIYYYTVTAQNEGGETNSSNEVDVEPINDFILSSANPGNQQVILSWVAPTGATLYDVKRGTVSGTYTTTLTNQTSPKTISGLIAGTTYYFSVTARNTHNGLVIATNELSAKPFSTFTISSATQSASGQVAISWAASTGAATYDVKYGTSSGAYGTTFTNTASTSTTITGLSNSQTYYFMITAINSSGSIDATTEVSVVMINTPSVPSTLTATATNSQTALTWAASSGSGTITYNILRSLSSGSGYASIASGVSGTSYTDTSLINGTTYYYVIQSSNIAGNSANSSEISGRPIASFSISSASAGVGSVTLSWSSASGTTSYDIQYGTVSGTYTTTISNQTSGATVSSLTAGTTYYFRIKASNSNNGISYTSEVNKVPLQSSDYNSPFDTGTSSSYTINSSNISFTSGGVCQLTPLDQTDDDNTASGFGGGTFVGVSNYGTLTGEASSSGLKLGSNGGCDGSTANCIGELAADWTPGYSNLVAYWKMNSSWNDSIGTNHFNANNSPTFTSPGKLGTATATFVSSSSQYLSQADNSNFQYGSGDFTVSFWFNASAPCTSNNSAMGLNQWNKGSVVATNSWYLNVCNGGVNNFGFAVEAASTNTIYSIINSATYSTNSWYHVVGSRIGTNIYLYVNGEQVATSAIGNISVASRGINLTLGANKDGLYSSNGNYDEVAIWKGYGLTAAEAKTIYDRQSPNYSGSFTSRVMDATSSQSWNSLAWTPTLPFFKALPDYANSAIQNETSSTYSSINTNSLMTGIVGLWHLDEAAGTTGAGSIKDTSKASASAINGTPTNVTFGASGKLNSAATFNGSSYIDFGSVPTFDFGKVTSFTIETWVKYTSNSSQYLLANGGNGNNGGFVTIISPSGGTLGALGLFLGGGALTSNVYVQTSSTYNDGNWHNLVAAVNQTAKSIKIYIDGAIVNISKVGTSCGTVNNSNTLDYSACPNATATKTYNTVLGKNPGAANTYFSGSLDEVAIWSRALSDTEILQLYQRGASRLKYQVRSCSDSTCTTGSPSWQGPDGTNETYFSELYNMSTQAATPSGTVNITAPSMSLQNYSNPISNNRYFQYRTIFESDSSTTSLMPELKSVSVGPTHYDSSTPSVIAIDGPQFTTLSGFTVTLGANGCSSTPKFELSTDKVTWYYYTSGSWTAATTSSYTYASDASTINSNIASFASSVGTGYLYVRSFLPPSGTSACEIDNIAITNQNGTIASSSNPGNFTASAVATSGQATLTWTPATSATSYTIRYGTTSGVYSGTAINQTSPATITGLTNNTPYYFLVYANDSTGSTPATYEVTATPLGTPTLSGIGDSGKVTLTYGSVAGATLYNIYRSTTSASTGFSSISTSASSGTYNNTGLTNGTTYYYKVTVTNGNNGTSTSSVLTISPFSYSWPFTSGTTSSYITSDSWANTSLTSGGVCQLTLQIKTDSDNLSTGFGGGTGVGVSNYGTLTGESSSSGLKLGNNNGCDGSTSNCAAELTTDWVPKYSNLVGLWHLNESTTGGGGASKDFQDSSPSAIWGAKRVRSL